MICGSQIRFISLRYSWDHIVIVFRLCGCGILPHSHGLDHPDEMCLVTLTAQPNSQLLSLYAVQGSIKHPDDCANDGLFSYTPLFAISEAHRVLTVSFLIGMAQCSLDVYVCSQSSESKTMMEDLDV
jgi:hypothetical protein